MESKSQHYPRVGPPSPIGPFPSKSNDKKQVITKKDPPSSDLFTNDGPLLSAPGAVRSMATNRLGEKKLDREERSSQSQERTSGTKTAQRGLGKNVGRKQNRQDQLGATFELNEPPLRNPEENPSLVSEEEKVAGALHSNSTRKLGEKKTTREQRNSNNRYGGRGFANFTKGLRGLRKNRPQQKMSGNANRVLSLEAPNSIAREEDVEDDAPLDATCEPCLLCDNAPLEGKCEVVPPSVFQKYRKVGGGVILFILIIIAIVVPVAVMSGGENNRNSKDTPDLEVDHSPPDVEVDPTLIPNVLDSTLVKLLDKNSPQYKAYVWMVQDPMFDQYEDWRKTQRYSLATFFYAMNGPRWKDVSWLDYEVNECEWLSHNHTCYDDMSYRLLVIPRKGGFKGSMPPELTLLTGLEGFNFSYNLLGGNLAGLFGNEFNYSSLRLFDCTSCRLGGTIPVELTRMTTLEGIILNNNDITGELPSELGQLKQLQVLELEDNKLSGAIPSTIGNLPVLWVLKLRGNLFSSLPSEVGMLSKTELKLLYLGGNRFRQSIPSELGALNNLELLDLDVGGFEGAIPSELGRLTNLTRLLLNRNKLSDSIPEEIGSLSNLQWLWMIDNKLVGSIPASIGNMTSLTKLDLGDNVLTSSIPSEIGLLLGLKELGLYKNELSGSIPSEIASLANLTVLDVANNPFLLPELSEEFCPSPPVELKTNWCSGDACCT